MEKKQKLNILMVDDQPAKLLSYETILGELNENLIRANSGSEALDRLLKTDIAVLLADVNMPDLDGFELAKIIRQHPRFQHMAIIFVSAVHLTDIDRVKGYKLGAVDYVTVPVIPEILRAKVGVFLDLYRKTHELENINSILEQRIGDRTAALAESEERFRLATEAMRGGLYDWRLADNHWWASTGLVSLTGSSATTDSTDQDWWQDRIHPDDLSGWQNCRAVLNSKLPTYDLQYRIRHHHGHWLWVWDRGRIMRDSDGHAVRVVGHVTDISLQKTAENALKDADQKKNEFLATLSHELRNPLAPICNALEILHMKDSSAQELQQSRDVIHRQVQHLNRLVDDLLDINRISRNKLELQSAPMDMTRAIRAAVEACSPMLNQLDHHLTLDIPESVMVRGDMVRLTQVFTNLLNNSIKYTPPAGEIILQVEEKNGQAIIRVSDNGKGIAADNLQHLFQMFYQASDAPQYSQDGFGVGLALVSEIVKLHGGRVEAASNGLKQGSTFTVYLPLTGEAGGDVLPLKKAGPHSGAVAGSIRRVLVADDNVDSAASLAMLLELHGYEVQVAHDGAEALSIATQFSPDAVLLDIGMPKLNGYDVARRLRKQDWSKEILLIAQTGWGQGRDQATSMEAGFDTHLTKPVDCHLLLELLGTPAEHIQLARNAR